jgi:ATP-dependent Clp protease ATP-binding subunit ClpC
MWKRFTEKARQVVFFAQEEATGRGQREVAPEHFLLALIRHEDSVAARLLAELGVSSEQVRCRIDERAPRDVWYAGEEMCLTPSGKRVIDLAYEEARRLNTNYIGTEHFLVALAGDETHASEVLRSFGASPERVKTAVDKVYRPAEQG